MNILVIKLGALGDLVQAFPAFAAIRAHHPGERITLLTTPPFRAIAQASPWFDRVATDDRPRAYQLGRLRALRRTLRGFDFVYDLQTSDRSGCYWWLAGRPPWSGIVRGASHRHANPARNRMHNAERIADQLAAAGIPAIPPPDLAWLRRGGPALPPNAALLVPGAAPQRPAKRWPVARYAELAAAMAARSLSPVIVGAAADAPLAAAIRATCPAAIDLTGQTDLQGLAAAAARATLAVGNDTGPMHLAALMGCPCVVLFSANSDPALAAPRGDVTVLREHDLADLPTARVAAAAFQRQESRSNGARQRHAAPPAR